MKVSRDCAFYIRNTLRSLSFEECHLYGVRNGYYSSVMRTDTATIIKKGTAVNGAFLLT